MNTAVQKRKKKKKPRDGLGLRAPRPTFPSALGCGFSLGDGAPWWSFGKLQEKAETLPQKGCFCDVVKRTF